MKTKPIIIMTGTLVIVLAIGFFMIRPTIVALYQTWRNLDTSKQNLKAADEKANAVNDLKKQKDQIINVASIAEKYIPKSYESSQLVLELTAIAQANSLTIQETSMENTKSSAPTSGNEATTSPTPTPNTSASAAPKSTLQNIDFSMKLAGKYPDFLNFLKTVETSSKLTVINNIALQMIAGTQDGSITVQLSGSSFYKPNVSIADTLENIKVSQETINMFLNLKSYGQTINPAESGYGRSDPFQGY
jgi:Tfp pilus assembly protein PilO